MITLNLVFEDILSEQVMFRILERFGNKYFIANSYAGNGSGYIKKGISGFNQASKFNPFFVLTDLDTYLCPSGLINDWLKVQKESNLIFRVAIREVESWLLADRKGISDFMGVDLKQIPIRSELLTDPKRSLISIATISKKRNIREDLVPKNNNATIGPNYNGRLTNFVLNFWSIDDAMKNSTSLARAVACIEKFQLSE